MKYFVWQTLYLLMINGRFFQIWREGILEDSTILTHVNTFPYHLFPSNHQPPNGVWQQSRWYQIRWCTWHAEWDFAPMHSTQWLLKAWKTALIRLFLTLFWPTFHDYYWWCCAETWLALLFACCKKLEQMSVFIMVRIPTVSRHHGKRIDPQAFLCSTQYKMMFGQVLKKYLI